MTGSRDVEIVLEEVGDERERQNEKWGQQEHTPGFWLMILGEEVGEANKAALEAAVEFVKTKKLLATDRLNDRNVDWNRVDLAEFRKELIQVAGVAVAMIEKIDRGDW